MSVKNIGDFIKHDCENVLKKKRKIIYTMNVKSLQNERLDILRDRIKIKM